MPCRSCIPRVAADGSIKHSPLSHLWAWCRNVFEVLVTGLWPTIFAVLILALVFASTEVGRSFGDLAEAAFLIVGLLVAFVVGLVVHARLYPGVTPQMWHMAGHSRRH